MHKSLSTSVAGAENALSIQLITAEEAAPLLRLHPVTVLRWAREGTIPHVKFGRKVLFPVQELNRWLLTRYTEQATRAATTQEGMAV